MEKAVCGNRLFVNRKKIMTTVFLFVSMLTSSVHADKYPPDQVYESAPIPNLPKPGYLQKTRDPVFGTDIMRITDADVFGKSNVRHHYSKDCPWNCDQTLIKISNFILDGETYRIVKTASLPSEDKWSYKDPDKIFGISGNKLVSYKLSFGTTTILHAFSAYSQIYMGPGEGNLSHDDGTVVLLSAQTGGDVIVYDIKNDQVVATKNVSVLGNFSKPDWVSISASGNYVVIDWRQLDSLQGGVVAYDRNLNKVTDVSARGEHGDLGFDEEGNDVFVHVCPFKMIRLKDGASSDIFTSGCGHLSLRNFKRRGWCYSSVGDDILAVKLDGSKTVEQFTHHRSTVGSYNLQPQAVARPDGQVVMFASDWGGGEVNSYVVSMPTD